MKVLFYTDGACEGNQFSNNFGGWGVVVIENNQIRQELYGAARNTTNNRMELFAVIKALEYANKTYSGNSPTEISIFSDSAYIVNCLKQKWYKKWQTNGWKTSKGTPVKNPDLWKKLLAQYQSLSVSFEKVKGHAGNKFNERADHLAVDAIHKQFH